VNPFSNMSNALVYCTIFNRESGKEPVAYLKLTKERLLYVYVIIEKGISHDHGNRASSGEDWTGLKSK
jgi:hypothetical protein